jgi:hypothetical protein
MNDFYSKRFGGPAHPAGPPPQRPAAAPPAPPPPTEPHYQRPTPSSLDDEHCPSCASANYMRSPQHPNTAKKCFDCGYPLVQSGTGVGGVGSKGTDGTVHKATQPASGGYHPTTIVGRVE